MFDIRHHGAVNGVTGSCHELILQDKRSVLVDCGLFQGEETSDDGAGFERLQIEFPVERIQALIITNVHVDHVGRIPYLLAAGFRGPIFCSEPSAVLLPLVLEDALKIGFTRDESLIERFLAQIERQLHPLPYKTWQVIVKDQVSMRVRLSPAGHILGSAYVELALQQGSEKQRIVFSGDLGAPYSPLLPAPKSPYAADLVVLESTYGDSNHESRYSRRQRLRQVLTRSLRDRGTVIIPAFSIGRTQELLYELEQLIHRYRDDWIAEGLRYDDLEVIVDSPLAARFTDSYRQLRSFWDKEARKKLAAGRHPLSFEQLTTIDDHQTHLQTVDYLARTGRPAVVLAAGGMCSGGRVVNYLKAMLEEAQHDIVFVGYQAVGTVGRDIQQYGPRGGYVVIDGRRFNIRAGVHTISGYSAHADQHDLTNFIKRMRIQPSMIRLVHGDRSAKQALRDRLQKLFPQIRVTVPVK